MVTKTEVLDGDWQLVRVEVAPHDEEGVTEAFDGYSRFWCKQAVLGTYWVAEKLEGSTIRIHLTEDIELVGFREPLSFVPDAAFKRELLARCDWAEVVREVFPDEEAQQLNLFDGVDDGEDR